MKKLLKLSAIIRKAFIWLHEPLGDFKYKDNSWIKSVKQKPVKKWSKPKKKYNVFPGSVKSKDGDIHFVSAYDLMVLYEVDPQECIVCKDKSYIDENLISLSPKLNYQDYKIKGGNGDRIK